MILRAGSMLARGPLRTVKWPLPLHDLIIIALCAFFGSLLYFGLRPGLLTYDWNYTLRRLLDGEFTRAFSPAYQYIWYCLLPWTKSQWPLLLASIVFYWAGVCLIGLALVPRSLLISLVAIFIALTPGAVHMAHVVNMDTAVASLMVFFIGYCLWSLERKEQIGIREISIACCALLFVAMMRYNAIVVVPIFSLMIGWMFFKKSLARIVFFGIFLTMAIVAIEGLVARELVGTKQNYIDNFTVRYDLVSLSVELGHTGVTSHLGAEEKAKISRRYETTGWYSRSQFEQVGRERLTREDWLRAVRESPTEYLAMRWRTFAKMFNGLAPPGSRQPLFRWPDYVHRNLQDFLKEKLAEKHIPESELTRKAGELNGVQAFYGTGLIWYFTNFPSSWYILILGAVIGLLVGILLLSGRRNKDLVWVAFVITGAVCWYLTVFFVVQKPMARYVYPANCLVLFSLPVFLAGTISSFRSREEQPS